MTVDLEDYCEDILGKAKRGLGLTNAEIAQIANLTVGEWEALLRKDYNKHDLQAVAPVLGLDADALVDSAYKRWHPEPVELPGLIQLNVPYGDMFVNAYLLHRHNSQEALLVDTGTEINTVLEAVAEAQVVVKAILVTHTHTDHIAVLNQLVVALDQPTVYAPAYEPLPGCVKVSQDDRFSIAGLEIECRQTEGHSPGGTTYCVAGLEQRIAFVGDALFAGSMGGVNAGVFDYAKDRIRSQILSLPAETLLCPGHGPITTVKEEKQHNPFFAAEFHSV